MTLHPAGAIAIGAPNLGVKIHKIDGEGDLTYPVGLPAGHWIEGCAVSEFRVGEAMRVIFHRRGALQPNEPPEGLDATGYFISPPIESIQAINDRQYVIRADGASWALLLYHSGAG